MTARRPRGGPGSNQYGLRGVSSQTNSGSNSEALNAAVAASSMTPVFRARNHERVDPEVGAEEATALIPAMAEKLKTSTKGRRQAELLATAIVNVAPQQRSVICKALGLNGGVVQLTEPIVNAIVKKSHVAAVSSRGSRVLVNPNNIEQNDAINKLLTLGGTRTVVGGAEEAVSRGDFQALIWVSEPIGDSGDQVLLVIDQQDPF